MNKETLKKLIGAAARPQAGINFSDAQSAARKALIEHFGLEDVSVRELKRHQSDIFAIIEEVLDEIVPKTLEERIGVFADVRTFARDEEVKFTIRSVGKRRVMTVITEGARGGLYRARRLDDKDFRLNTKVESAAYQITLEELLTGRRTIAELVEIIAQGFVENVYINVIKAMRAAYVNAPAKNKATGNGIDKDKLDAVIRVVGAYGTPMLIGFEAFAQAMDNAVEYGTSGIALPESDLEDIKNTGMVGKYKGRTIVILPNYLVDESNTQWMFKESDLFILPVDEKPIKVAFQGESYTRELAQAHGGMEVHVHRILGVGMLFNHNIGIYTNVALTEGLI